MLKLKNSNDNQSKKKYKNSNGDETKKNCNKTKKSNQDIPQTLKF